MAFIHRAILLLACVAYAKADWNPLDFLGNWQNSFCNSTAAQYFPTELCPSTTTTASTPLSTVFSSTYSTPSSTSRSTAATSPEFTIGITPVTPTTDPVQGGTTTSSTPLERAHWCKFQNGTTIALGYSFMYSTCAVCQCLPSRLIRCTNLQCMSTFCIDGSQPTTREGQCCSQCAYENTSNTCTYSTVSVPHGTIVKRSSNGETCWCQAGTIECRRVPSMSTGSDMLGSGMGTYLIVIIIVIMLLVGSLSCIACAGFLYYHSKKQNQTVNEEYDQYWNQAGWQPMDADGAVEEKKVEAEHVINPEEYPNGFDPAYVPPPYVTYNGAYPNEKSQ